MPPIRLLVVEAHTIFRDGLVSLLERDAEIQVVGQAASAGETLQLSRELVPDVILIDVKTPGLDAAEATRRLLEATPGTQILMLADDGEQEGLLAALGAGAHGYLLKDTAADIFLETIRRVHGEEMAPASSGRGHETSIAMPSRPVHISLLERLVGALPLPYAASAAVFATVFGPPTTVALGLLATGNLATTIELYFGGMPPDATWQQAAAILFWWLTYFVTFWAVRRERLAITREGEALTQVMPAEVRERWAPHNRNAAWPPVLVAIILTVISWPFVIAVLESPAARQLPVLGAIWVAQNVVRLGLFFLGLGTVFWLAAAALLSLVWLGRQPLSLVPLEYDALLGLRPAGSMALTMASTYMGIVSLLAVQLALAPAIGPFAPTLVVSVVFGVGLFFAPLWGLHRKMRARKEGRQAQVRRRLLQLASAADPPNPERSHGRLGGASTAANARQPRDSLAWAAEVLALDAAGRTLDASPTWPFDLDILGRLGGAVMLPIVIGLLTQLMGRVLGL